MHAPAGAYGPAGGPRARWASGAGWPGEGRRVQRSTRCDAPSPSLVHNNQHFDCFFLYLPFFFLSDC